MTTDEAIEAAAKTIYEDGWQGPPHWESLPEYHIDKLQARVVARAALEAAAPHMLAEAWEQGRDAEFQRSVMKRQTEANPYRTHPEPAPDLLNSTRPTKAER